MLHGLSTNVQKHQSEPAQKYEKKPEFKKLYWKKLDIAFIQYVKKYPKLSMIKSQEDKSFC